MNPFYLDLGYQPSGIRFILLCLFVLLCVSAVRLTKLALRLYRFVGRASKLRAILRGGGNADLIAASAFAGSLRDRDLIENPSDHTLCAADARFTYLWDRGHADVESTRRASTLAVLLSMSMVAYGAYPLYQWYFNDTNRTGEWSLFWTIQQLLALLSIGFPCAAILYFASSFFERILAHRKARWRYVYASLRMNRASTEKAPFAP
jgi:hypothetical protein